MKFVFFFIIFICIDTIGSAQNLSKLENDLLKNGFVDIRSSDNTYIVDLKYATTDNFTKQVLYDSLNTPFLHPEANKKLCIAHQYLKEINPNYRFIIFDVARPLQIQKNV